ncbi:MAG: response regulator transcription factor [Chloroflexota bacterium]|nr:response regulator transcription factor [Chloroflexota bacterium]
MVVDDHPVVREGLSAMLSREEDFEVVGEAKDGQEAVERAAALKPAVVLMDLKMPRMDGVEAIRQIKRQQPEVEVIVLTTFDSDEYIFQGIEAGARGYLLKDAPRDDLFRAVRAVARGESLLQPAVAARLVNRFAELSRRTPAEDALSARELEVLRLLASGAANKEIASRLIISESTVKTHVTNIFQKLGASDRTQAVTLALQRGLIKL